MDILRDTRKPLKKYCSPTPNILLNKKVMFVIIFQYYYFVYFFINNLFIKVFTIKNI